MLRDGYVLFILTVSLFVNTLVFGMEWVAPTSAEHWHVGLAMLTVATITKLWERRYERCETWYDLCKVAIMEYTFWIMFINGVWAIFLDGLAWVVK